MKKTSNLMLGIIIVQVGTAPGAFANPRHNENNIQQPEAVASIPLTNQREITGSERQQPQAISVPMYKIRPLGKLKSQVGSANVQIQPDMDLGNLAPSEAYDPSFGGPRSVFGTNFEEVEGVNLPEGESFQQWLKRIPVNSPVHGLSLSQQQKSYEKLHSYQIYREGYMDGRMQAPQCLPQSAYSNQNYGMGSLSVPNVLGGMAISFLASYLYKKYTSFTQQPSRSQNPNQHILGEAQPFQYHECYGASDSFVAPYGMQRGNVVAPNAVQASLSNHKDLHDGYPAAELALEEGQRQPQKPASKSAGAQSGASGYSSYQSGQ